MTEKITGAIMYSAREVGDIVELVVDVLNTGRRDYDARFDRDGRGKHLDKGNTASLLRQAQREYRTRVPNDVKKELSQTFALRDNPDF